MSAGVIAHRQDMLETAAGRAGAARALQLHQMPEDIVGTVAFLWGPDSAFITGKTIVVDGGVVMR